MSGGPVPARQRRARIWRRPRARSPHRRRTGCAVVPPLAHVYVQVHAAIETNGVLDALNWCSDMADQSTAAIEDAVPELFK